MVSRALSENGPLSLHAWKKDMPLSVSHECGGRMEASVACADNKVPSTANETIGSCDRRVVVEKTAIA